jgi:hypothetical protein
MYGYRGQKQRIRGFATVQADNSSAVSHVEVPDSSDFSQLGSLLLLSGTVEQIDLDARRINHHQGAQLADNGPDFVRSSGVSWRYKTSSRKDDITLEHFRSELVGEPAHR